MSSAGKRACDGGRAMENVMEIPASASLSSPGDRIKQNNEFVDAIYHRNHMEFVFVTQAIMLANVASVIVMRVVSKLCLFCCCRCYL
jgi:hypothetical protein